jgi:hypothetical protein
MDASAQWERQRCKGEPERAAQRQRSRRSSAVKGARIGSPAAAEWMRQRLRRLLFLRQQALSETGVGVEGEQKQVPPLVSETSAQVAT